MSISCIWRYMRNCKWPKNKKNKKNQLNFTNLGGLWKFIILNFVFLFPVVVSEFFPLNFVCIYPKWFWIFNLNTWLHTNEEEVVGVAPWKRFNPCFVWCQPQLQAQLLVISRFGVFVIVRLSGSSREQHSRLFGEDEEFGTKRPFRLELILFFFLFLSLRKICFWPL